MLKMSYEDIIKLFDQNEETILREKINELHPADAVQIINDLPDEYQVKAFSYLNAQNASDVLPDLFDDVKDEILSQIKQIRLVKIIDEMETDEATDIIADLEDEVSREVLEKLEILDREDTQSIKKLLRYDEDSAGGLMQTEIIAVQRSKKRDQLIEYIREHYEEVENIHYVYVVNDEGKLIGILDLAKLLLATPERRAVDMMNPDVISVNVAMDQEDVARLFRKYDQYSLPVVDDSNLLLGRITMDDILDVIDEEASEDAYKMVGLESEDKVFTAPLSSVGKRLPWLALNLLTALIISSVVAIFESSIQILPVLAVLMPIVAGLGGNSGIQTLTVITRGIAMGELTVRNTYKAIMKEVTVGLINGVIIGSIATGLAYLLKGNLMLGVVLGSAMVCNMFIAGLMGSLIPTIMKALKIDPALASSVIITMLTDIGGYASFLGLATWLLL